MPAAVEEILEHLAAVSFVAGRDARAALPAVAPLGRAAELRYLETGRDLFFYDREAGKAYFHATAGLVTAFGGLDPWLEQARVFTSQRGTWKAAVAFFEQAAAVACDFGKDAEEAWFAEGATWLASHVDSAVAYFRLPAAELLGSAGVAGLERFFAPARMLLERRVGLGTYLAGALQVRASCGEAGLAEWARRGVDTLQAGRLRGEAWFRLESDEARSFLLEILPGFRTRPARRLLSLLVQGWLGIPLPLEEGDWHPSQGRASVETDGRRLYLPAVLPDREEALAAVYHASAHVAFGSYDRDAVESLFREIGMEHPPVDTDSRITWRPLFRQFGEDLVRFQMLFDLCEDLRVDLRLDGEMPGWMARLLRLARARSQPQGPAGAYYAEGLAQLEAAVAGHLPEDLATLARPEAGILDSFRVALARYADTALPPLSLAERTAAYLPGRSPNAARPVYPTIGGKPAEEGDLDEGGPLEAQGHEDLAREAPKDGAGNDPDMEIPPEDIQGAGGRVGVGLPMPAVVSGKGKGTRGPEGGIPYPEWDYQTGRYKEGWARVHLRRLREENGAEAQAIAETYGGVIRRLKRALQAQKPTRLAPLRRQYEGDELDLDAAVQFVAERRAGRSPKSLIYRRRRPLQRDTAVLLLADLSTSIMAEVQEGGGRVVDRLRAGMLLFGEALAELGDPFALYGFASKYHDEVVVYPIKPFDRPFDQRARAWVGGLSGRLATRMGAAIRHCTRTLARNPAERKLLLILSDGRPADYDDGGDSRYLHEDTRMAVKEALDQGVHAFCITLDPGGGDYLPAIFGPGHYLVLSHVDSLPARLPEIYLRLKGWQAA